MNAAQLIAKVSDLPTPSPAALRLMQLLALPEADTEEIIHIVQRDAILTTKLLAVCNSAARGLVSPVGSVEQAVILLGQAEIYRLVMAISFSSALNPNLDGYGIQENELWRHSLLTAMASNWILAAGVIADADPAMAYTAGLIHDIGKIAVSQVLDTSAQAAVRERIKRQESLIEAEREVFGTDHAEVGACLLERWRLPAVIVEAVAKHHAPVLTPRPTLSAVIHVANIIAYEAGAATGWGTFAVRADEAAVEALGLGEADIEQFLMLAFDAQAQVAEMVSLA